MWLIIVLLVIILLYSYDLRETFLDPYSIYLNEDMKYRQRLWDAEKLYWLGGPCD